VPPSRAQAVVAACREFRRGFATDKLHVLMDTQQAFLEAILRYVEALPPGSPQGSFIRDPAVKRAHGAWTEASASWRAVTE